MIKTFNLSPITSLSLISIIVLIVVSLNTAFQNIQTNEVRNVAVQVNTSTAITQGLAEDIADVFFSQNRTNLIVDEIKQLQLQILEFERMTEEARQEQTASLLPIFIRQFNQTDAIEQGIANLTERIDRALLSKQIEQIEMQEEIIVLLNEVLNKTS